MDPKTPDPSAVFDTLNAYQRSAALRGAIELDLFTAIGQGHDTAKDLAETLGLDRRATRILCDFLAVCGFLTKQNEHYGLSATAAVFLDRRSPQYMGSAARFIHSQPLQDAFRDVAELVRRGSTLLDGQGTTEPEFEGWVEFARSMVPMMMPAANFMAQLVQERKSGAIRVLDIAAGHGMFGISIARANSQACIVALDWNNVLNVAQENARQHGVHERYSSLLGDALQIDYGTDYDVVLVTNFLHHFNPKTVQDVMKKIERSLKRDGIVLTLEFVPDESRIAPPTAATFAFTMLGTTPAGDAYTFSEYCSMWRQAGLTSHELIDVPDSPQRLTVSHRDAVLGS